MRQFDEEACDPLRFNRRGYSGVQESKRRAEYQRKLQMLDSSIFTSTGEWEQSEGNPFCLNGAEYRGAEILDSERTHMYAWTGRQLSQKQAGAPTPKVEHGLHGSAGRTTNSGRSPAPPVLRAPENEQHGGAGRATNAGRSPAPPAGRARVIVDVNRSGSSQKRETSRRTTSGVISPMSQSTRPKNEVNRPESSQQQNVSGSPSMSNASRSNFVSASNGPLSPRSSQVQSPVASSPAQNPSARRWSG